MNFQAQAVIQQVKIISEHTQLVQLFQALKISCGIF